MFSSICAAVFSGSSVILLSIVIQFLPQDHHLVHQHGIHQADHDEHDHVLLAQV